MIQGLCTMALHQCYGPEFIQKEPAEVWQLRKSATALQLVAIVAYLKAKGYCPSLQDCALFEKVSEFIDRSMNWIMYWWPITGWETFRELPRPLLGLSSGSTFDVSRSSAPGRDVIVSAHNGHHSPEEINVFEAGSTKPVSFLPCPHSVLPFLSDSGRRLIVVSPSQLLVLDAETSQPGKLLIQGINNLLCGVKFTTVHGSWRLNLPLSKLWFYKDREINATLAASHCADDSSDEMIVVVGGKIYSVGGWKTSTIFLPGFERFIHGLKYIKRLNSFILFFDDWNGHLTGVSLSDRTAVFKATMPEGHCSKFITASDDLRYVAAITETGHTKPRYITIWNASGAQTISFPITFQTGNRAIEFNGQKFFYGKTGAVVQLDPENGKEINTFALPRVDAIGKVKATSDGKTLYAYGSDMLFALPTDPIDQSSLPDAKEVYAKTWVLLSIPPANRNSDWLQELKKLNSLKHLPFEYKAWIELMIDLSKTPGFKISSGSGENDAAAPEPSVAPGKNSAGGTNPDESGASVTPGTMKEADPDIDCTTGKPGGDNTIPDWVGGVTEVPDDPSRLKTWADLERNSELNRYRDKSMSWSKEDLDFASSSHPGVRSLFSKPEKDWSERHMLNHLMKIPIVFTPQLVEKMKRSPAILVNEVRYGSAVQSFERIPDILAEPESVSTGIEIEHRELYVFPECSSGTAMVLDAEKLTAISLFTMQEQCSITHQLAFSKNQLEELDDTTAGSVQHGPKLISVCLSSDERLCAFSTKNNPIRIWDLEHSTVKDVLRNTLVTFDIEQLSFLNNDEKLFVLGNHPAHPSRRSWVVIDLRTGQIERSGMCADKSTREIKGRVLPDLLLAGSNNSTPDVQQYFETIPEVGTLVLDQLFTLDKIENGKVWLLEHEGASVRVRTFDFPEGTMEVISPAIDLSEMKRRYYSDYRMTVTPDGKHLLALGRHSIKIYELETGVCKLDKPCDLPLINLNQVWLAPDHSILVVGNSILKLDSNAPCPRRLAIHFLMSSISDLGPAGIAALKELSTSPFLCYALRPAFGYTLELIQRL